MKTKLGNLKTENPMTGTESRRSHLENPMRKIRIEKIVLNVGGIAENLEKGFRLLSFITKRKPARMKSKKRIPSLEVRPGLEVGAVVTIRKNKDVLTSYELKLSKPENDVFNSVTEMIKKMEMLRHLNPEFGEKVSSEDIYECSIIELLLNAYERSLLNSDGLNSPIDLAMVYDSINSSTETTIGKVKKFESEVIPYLGEYLDNAVRD